MTGIEFIEMLLRYIDDNQAKEPSADQGIDIDASCDITWDNFTYRVFYKRHNIERVYHILHYLNDPMYGMICKDCPKFDFGIKKCKELHEFVRIYKEHQEEYDKAFTKYFLLNKLS